MITYTRQQYGYSEMVGLSSDKKPIADNGSLFTEMETGKQFRFNGATNEWIAVGEPFPVSLSEKDGKYTAVFSDGTESAVDILEEKDGKAKYLANGVAVYCDIPVKKKAKASKEKKNA